MNDIMIEDTCSAFIDSHFSYYMYVCNVLYVQEGMDGYKLKIIPAHTFIHTTLLPCRTMLIFYKDLF